MTNHLPALSELIAFVSEFAKSAPETTVLESTIMLLQHTSGAKTLPPPVLEETVNDCAFSAPVGYVRVLLQHLEPFTSPESIERAHELIDHA